MERKLQKHEAFERELQANEKQLRNVESVCILKFLYFICCIVSSYTVKKDKQMTFNMNKVKMW